MIRYQLVQKPDILPLWNVTISTYIRKEIFTTYSDIILEVNFKPNSI